MGHSVLALESSKENGSDISLIRALIREISHEKCIFFDK